MSPLLFIHFDLTDLCVPKDSPLAQNESIFKLLVDHPYHAGFLIPSDATNFNKTCKKNEIYATGIEEMIDFPRVRESVTHITKEIGNIPEIVVINTQPTEKIIPPTKPYMDAFTAWYSAKYPTAKHNSISVKNDFFHYTSWFRTIKGKLPQILKNHDHYFWVTGGQLPSINLALFLNLLPMDTKFTAIGHDLINNSCFALKLTSELYETRLKKEILLFSSKCEYTAILNLAAGQEAVRIARVGSGLQTLDWSEIFTQKEFINRLIDGLDQPFEMDEGIDDFEEKEMDLSLPGSARASALLNEMRTKIDLLNDTDDSKSRPNKLVFIYLSAKIKYFKQQSYSDFLMRIFTMAEVLLLPELAPLISTGKILNIRLDDLIPDREAPKIIIASILSKNSWQEFVQNYIPYPYSWKIGSKQQPTFFLHRAIWECFFEKEPGFQKDTNILLKDALVYIDALRDIRNKVAHNLEGTGQDEILDSFITIDGDLKNPGRLFTPVNKTEYRLRYEEYERWVSLPSNETKIPEPVTDWSIDERKELRKLHEKNFFTLCDKYFGIYQEGVTYDQNFGFFDTHINPLIKYYLGINETP
ncbi:MAG: hypothetical protein NW241_11040 [Bacteroidia bacterium]|nr:hypothetical protein [Bacteroidia bacterium]